MRTWTRTVVVAALLALSPSAPARADEPSPRQVVQQITDAVLAVLRDRSLDAETKRLRIQDLVYAHVDFDTMSRLVLARNYSRFSPDQRAEFTRLFKEHLSLTYGRSIENYRDEQVEVTGDHDEPDGDWTVKSRIVRGGGADTILLDYRLRKEDGAWRIIDIIIERVSLVSNYRSQFQELVSQGGPEKVLQVLREKNSKREPLKAPGT
jgi:phospholipid transport system substrate-binding protein